MNCYPMAALERTMKIQEVILRALAKKISWWQAAETIGITDPQMRRWHWRYQEYGYDGLLDRRLAPFLVGSINTLTSVPFSVGDLDAGSSNPYYRSQARDLRKRP